MSTINKGETVLVTGVTGYIGSWVAVQLIEAGYKVRGTSRSADRAKDITDAIEKKFGSGKLEIAEVPDMVAENAYDEAVKGVSGIVHLASVLTFSTNPDEVIPQSVKGTLNAFKAATLEPKVKSFVFCSSSTAALTPVPNKKLVITKDTWNDSAVKAAYEPNATGVIVYCASKTEAEKALWRAVKETNPPFQVAAVLPNANFGPLLRKAGTGSSTGDWIPGLYNGSELMFGLVPQYAISVVDTAKLHVAALTDPACNGDRIFAFAMPFNANDLLAILRRMYPEKQFLEDREDIGRDLTLVPNDEAEALLRKHYGHGWTSLEEMVKQNMAEPGA